MDPKGKKMQPYERAADLTADKAKQELDQVHDYLEDLREKYGFHQAVFSVENVDVKKGGFLKPSFFKVTGHVIYGTFTPLDEVSIGMNSGQIVKISCLDNPHSSVPVSDATIQCGTNKLLIDWAWVEGGEEAAFIFQEKSLNLKSIQTHTVVQYLPTILSLKTVILSKTMRSAMGEESLSFTLQESLIVFSREIMPIWVVLLMETSFT